jgi:hypothetical protein
MNDAIFNTIQDNVTTIDPDFIQNYNSLSEGLANTPAIQVYWQNFEPVSSGSETDRRTFGGDVKPVRRKDFTFNVDLYCDPIGHLDAVMPQMLPIVDELINILENQDQKPYFGLADIKAYTFEAQRGVIEYANTNYPVVQFVINLVIF